MTKFMGRVLNVKVFVENSNSASYYDPATKAVHLSNGWIASLARAVVGRTRKWLLGHELGHAYLDTCSVKERRALSRVFGSLSESAYSSNPLKELYAFVGGFDRSRYLSARGTLCPEEDFAECCGYLYSGGTIERYQGTVIEKKLQAVRRIVGEGG